MNRTAMALLTGLLAVAAMYAQAAIQPAAAQNAESKTARMSGTEIQETATAAYRYFYPIVTMDVTRRQMTNVAAPGDIPGYGPMNTFSNFRAYPSAEMKVVVRPNFDTLYSIAWLDVTREPMIVSTPNTEGRYYLLEMLDMWTDAFASPGKRTTGTDAAHFAVTPPGWTGSLPEGVQRIDAPTRYVWIIGRTQTNGPKDYAAVNKIQDGYVITPLSRWGMAREQIRGAVDPGIDMKTPTLKQVNAMSAGQYFTYAHALMKQHQPHLTDWSLVAQMKRIGFDAGKDFNFDSLELEVKQALEKAVSDGPKDLAARIPNVAPIVKAQFHLAVDATSDHGKSMT